MSIRDDLATRLARAGSAIAWEPDDEAYLLADAVLDWIGQLDPDADPELIALHLRDTRAELERLREAIEARDAGVVRLTAEIDRLRGG